MTKNIFRESAGTNSKLRRPRIAGRMILLSGLLLAFVSGCKAICRTMGAEGNTAPHAELYANPRAADRLWEDEIIYVVIPDKFYNADRTNDYMRERFPGEEYQQGYRGGDIEGVIRKLDYLVDLGVTTILLYPIHKNDRNPFFGFLPGGYRVKDYFDVDENLGDLDLARKLVKQAHARGLRMILDMPISLASYENPFNSPEFREKGWISDRSAWGMSAWNTDNPDTADYLLRVGRFWRDELDFDGFRIDSAHLIPNRFWKQFADAIRDEEHPDFFLMAEVIGNMEMQSRFLEETGFDSLYDWGTLRTQQIFGGDGALSLINFVQYYSRLHYPNTSRMVAKIDNYEEKTFISTAAEPMIDRKKMALAFLMTFDRIPLLYSGSEHALDYSEPGALFEPENQNPEVFEYLRRLIAIRKQETALRRGEFEEAYREEPVIAYTRTWNNEQVLVVMNRSDSEQSVLFPLGETEWKALEMTDLMTGEQAKLSGADEPLRMLPFSARILKRIGK